MSRSTISRVLSHARNLGEAVEILAALDILDSLGDDDNGGKDDEPVDDEEANEPSKEDEGDKDTEDTEDVDKREKKVPAPSHVDVGRGVWHTVGYEGKNVRDSLIPATLVASRTYPEILDDKGVVKPSVGTWMAYGSREKSETGGRIKWKKIPPGYVLIDPHSLAINGPQNPKVLGFLLRTFLEKSSQEGDEASVSPGGDRRPFKSYTDEERKTIYAMTGGKKNFREGKRIKTYGRTKNYMTILYYAKQLPARQSFVLSPYVGVAETKDESSWRYFRETTVWVSAGCLKNILYKIVYSDGKNPLGEDYLPLTPMVRSPSEYDEVSAAIARPSCDNRIMNGMDAATILGKCLTDAEWQAITDRYSKEVVENEDGTVGGGGTPHTHYVEQYDDKGELDDYSHPMSYRDAYRLYASRKKDGYDVRILERRYIPWQHSSVTWVYEIVARKISQLDVEIDEAGDDFAKMNNAIRAHGDIKFAFYRWLAERYVRAIKIGNLKDAARKSTVGKNSYRIATVSEGNFVGPSVADAKVIAHIVRLMLVESCRKILVRGGAKIDPALLDPCVEDRMQLLSAVHYQSFKWSLDRQENNPEIRK